METLGVVSKKTTNTEVTIVTAICHSSYMTWMGGRDYTVEFYAPNLISIVNLGFPIEIYADANSIHQLLELFERIHFKQFQIHLINLHAFQYSTKIAEIKKRQLDENGYLISGQRNDRLHHLILQKPDWVWHSISANTWQSKYYLWVDAGLFHNGLFPETLGGKERVIQYSDSDYFPCNSEDMFNPVLGHGILQHLKNHGGICVEFQGDDFSDEEKMCFFNISEYTTRMIGGIFGGSKDKYAKWFEKYRQYRELFMQKNELFTEETVLSFMLKKDIILPGKLTFDRWLHSVPGDMNRCYVPAFEKQYSFWEIFRDFTIDNK